MLNVFLSQFAVRQELRCRRFHSTFSRSRQDVFHLRFCTYKESMSKERSIIKVVRYVYCFVTLSSDVYQTTQDLPWRRSVKKKKYSVKQILLSPQRFVIPIKISYPLLCLTPANVTDTFKIASHTLLQVVSSYVSTRSTNCRQKLAHKILPDTFYLEMHRTAFKYSRSRNKWLKQLRGENCVQPHCEAAIAQESVNWIQLA